MHQRELDPGEMRSLEAAELSQVTDRAEPEVVPPQALPNHAAAPIPASVPEIYQLRFSESKAMLAGQAGGDASTEAAVEAALRWLAANQESHGGWDAARHGAGRETRTLERDRKGPVRKLIRA